MAKFFFDRTTRIIMRLNFFLAFGKTEKIDEESQELIKYGKRNRNFIITMMKIFNFYLENNQFDEALKIEKVLIPACKNEKYDSVNKEIKLLHRLYINKDPNLKSELKIELENVINPEEKMIILYRLTKICELMGEKHQANTYLNQLKIISKNQIKQINKAEEF
ncbi:hypothetical protein Q2T76_07080 [Lactobacillus sp. YT155]|uniref:hypothetical protein n=1 Tax=Lactobacillus sp. YT155 TaxID=3060955 RepID=UPI002660194C|nr:hypothetical protein [Lactobacillus sp. YT155]MDO1605821.1 hypothetical protein [Lactobacillus sp. YT155]